MTGPREGDVANPGPLGDRVLGASLQRQGAHESVAKARLALALPLYRSYTCLDRPDCH